MAKKSSIEKNDRRKQLTQRYAAKRKALKAVILNVHASDEEKMAAQFALQRLPRNSSKTRIRNRCQMTGRSRGFESAFGLSRIAMREMALNGFLPGVRKASW
ncbi:MAG TPA: 30S ribosomal protein S14 [Gemmatimonadaceae bacterium]|jgi:small subunit ribosomal protein S14